MRRFASRLVHGAARIGHAATGIVYALVGALAIAASVDRQLHPAGPEGALHELGATSIGAVATLIVAVGLVADAAWQGLRAWRDYERVGAGLTGVIDRISAGVTGLLHLGLALAAARLVLMYDTSETLESRTTGWLSIALSVRLGGWLVALLAGITFAVAVTMIYRGAAPGVLARLNIAHLDGTLRSVASLGARLGFFARGTIYALVAASVGAAAYHHSASEVRAVGGAMRVLQYDRDGRWLLAAIALGFIANGAVEIIRAWHRTIRT